MSFQRGSGGSQGGLDQGFGPKTPPQDQAGPHQGHKNPVLHKSVPKFVGFSLLGQNLNTTFSHLKKIYQTFRLGQVLLKFYLDPEKKPTKIEGSNRENSTLGRILGRVDPLY